MSAYVIDFSDPLKNGFSIPAGGFNGPGGSNANTTLRLYGRGALEWGEAVDEDLVRLTENFASASPPSVAVQGQLWAEVTLYYHNDSLPLLQGWYFYDLNSLLANKWTLLNGTGIISNVVPITPVIGQYYYVAGGSDTVNHPTGVVNGYYSLGRYEPATFVPRSYITNTGVPNASTFPRTTLRVRDSAAGAWSSPSTTTASPTSSPPTNPQQGQLWYNTTTGNLNVWAGTAWQEILGPSNTDQSTSSGLVNMGGFKIVNMADPTAAQDAATRAYVLAQVAGAGAGVFVTRTGDTMTGTLTMTTGNIVVSTGTLTVSSGNTSLTTLSTSGLATLASASITTATLVNPTVTGATLVVNNAATIGTTLTMGGQINMQTNRIVNMGNAVGGQDAVTLSQVTTLISGSGGTTPAIITTFAGTPATYKAGDIAINAGKIYIANAGGTNNVVPPAGNWKKVFPAVYA